MTRPDTDAPIDAPSAGGMGAMRWAAVVAAVLVALVPPAGPATLALLGLSLLVLIAGLWSRPGPSGRLGPGFLAAAGGLLVVLGLFAAANPWSGAMLYGWPWDLIRADRPFAGRADALLLLLAGAFAAGVGLARPRGPGAFALLIGLALFLVARAGSDSALLPRIRVEGVTFLFTCGACALGAGLLHLASARSARRGIARSLVLVGAVAMVSVWVGHFPERQGTPASSLSTSVDEVRRVVAGYLLGQEQDAESRREVAERGLALAVPFLLRVVAVLCGLLAAAAPARRVGRSVRALALLGLLSTFLAWLVPPKAALWIALPERPSEMSEVLARHASDVALRSGLAAWLMVVGAIGALLSRADGESAPAWPRGGARSYAPRWTYVVGALLLLAAIIRGFHPGTGSIAPAGLGSVLASPRWDPAVASLVFLAVTLLASLAATLLPSGAGRGGLIATASVTAWAALTSTAARDYGIEGWVPLAVLAVAAGALRAGTTASAAGRAAARWTAGAAGCVLLLLVVYPLPVQVPAGGGEHVFNNPLVELTRGWEGDPGTPSHVAASAPWRLGIVIDAAVALLALLFAVRGTAAGGRIAAGAFLLDLAYSALWQGVVDFHDLKTAFFQWGDALLFHGIPMALLLWSGVRDLHATPGGGVPSRATTGPTGANRTG
ncbi:MAG TPA: hypothetical protein VND21_04080 [Planctomycetota bacterium]|nr:hypothetical protein [Planctomycetota bacterium]